MRRAGRAQALKLDRIRRAGTHFMGRTTYEEMTSYWLTSSDDYAAPITGLALDTGTLASSSGSRSRAASEARRRAELLVCNL
jgi:Asp-tRNA(Asn)/Glu-tRNA(Gln) amidotransferase A subunit family amidase